MATLPREIDRRHVPPRRRGRIPGDRDERRRRILSAAAELFIAAGYAETTLDAVGRAAGVTKRSIYDLIGDKAALFREVCQAGQAGIGTMQLSAPGIDRPLREELLALAEALVAFALSDQTVALERVLFSEQALFPDLARALIAATRSTLTANICGAFQLLLARERIADIDPSRASEIFFDLVVGNRGFRKALGSDETPPTPGEIVERVDIFLKGYLDR